MSDLFHERVPDEYIASVVKVMELAPWHTYQVLTKRAERLATLLTTTLRAASRLTHVWWGVSVENRKHGLPRIEQLRRVPSRIRFLSVEPLLEDLGAVDFGGLQWVIVGGESGHGARPMERDWVRSIMRQCHKARVPFFFKQWGGVQKSRYGRLLDGRTYDEMPASVQGPILPAQERRERLLKIQPWQHA